MTDIRINADKWHSLSDKQQEKVLLLVRTKGWLGNNDQIVPDPDLPVPRWIKPDYVIPDTPGSRDCYQACEDYGDVVYIACKPHDSADNCAELAGDAVEECIYENC